MSSLIFPPYVQKGDRVIILSPSSKIDKSFLKGAQKRLKSWGLEVVMAKHAGSSHGTYGGSIKQRVEDLQDALDDEKADRKSTRLNSSHSTSSRMPSSA